MRTAYQIDRDRIIHSKAFRRLKHKTQVFIAPVGDHYRTRLTHTMEVMQVARSIARGLNLNEDLTEAIALGHDLGHTPFGHAGEYALGACLSGGFRHNEQSVRVVEVLEKDGRGLNLTREVRDGILKHSKLRESIAAEGWGIARHPGRPDRQDRRQPGLPEPRHRRRHPSRRHLGRRPARAGQRGLRHDLGLAHHRLCHRRGRLQLARRDWARATRWQDAVGNGIAVGMSPEVLAVVDELREFMFSTRLYRLGGQGRRSQDALHRAQAVRILL